MSTKKHKLKLRILCAFMAFLVAFVHIPITSFAATDEVLQDNTVVISLDEILDKLIKTRGNGITVNGLDEEVRDEIGDAAIVMKGTESGITYLVVAYIMGEDSEMYRNKDKAEIINSILSLSVVFVNKKDTEQEINFVFQADDLCEYNLMEDLRTVKEPEQEESESKKKSKSVETTQTESKENNNEVSTEPSGEESAEANSEINAEADVPPSEDSSDESPLEAEAAPSEDVSAQSPLKAEITPSEDVSAESPSEADVTPSEDASAESPSEAGVAPSEDASAESPSEAGIAPSEDASAQSPSEADVPPSNETPAVPPTENVTIPPVEITNNSSVLSEADLASSDAVNYQAPVEAAVLATALDAAAVPSAIQYEGIGSFSNGSVRLLGKSAGAVDIQLGEAALSEKYQAYMTGYGIKIIGKDEEYIAYCYNSSKHNPNVEVNKNPLYIKYEYDNLPPEYTEHIENGSDVLGANQDVIAMLLAVGYPNDSRGYQKKHGIPDVVAYETTQFILHFILNPKILINSFRPNPDDKDNPNKPHNPDETLSYEQALERYLNENPYAKDVYNAAMEGFSYDFSFELEGNIVFDQAEDGSYQTDILTTKGTLNGYYEFETLPGNIKVRDLKGNDISKKEIKLGESFRFVSSTMPTTEESFGIRITCKHSTPTIYYYMPENNAYQNLLSLELSDSHENRKLNIRDVIQPGDPDPDPEEPPVDHDPETPSVNPDPEIPSVTPEPETPTVIPDNNTPSGGGGPSGNTPDNNGPGPGTVPEATIPDGDVPLAQLPPAGLPSDPDLSLIEIDDGEVPLAPLPKTGQESAAGKLFLFSSLLGGLWLMTEMKSRKKNG